MNEETQTEAQAGDGKQHPESLSDPPKPDTAVVEVENTQSSLGAIPVLGYDALEPHDAAILLCAMIIHNTVEAMNDAHNELTLSWEENKATVIAGVQRMLANPGETPETNHDAWWKFKVDAGWKYGPNKDPVAKTHPCMVPYEALGPFAKSKDAVFQTIVRTMFGVK